MSEDTRTRIIDAAIATLQHEGFSGMSARAIAKRGGFNQALIFYHFGSLNNLLLETFRTTSASQVEHYKAAAASVSSLSELVEIARRLHNEDISSGRTAAVTQLMAAAASEPDVGHAVLEGFSEWIGIVEDGLRGALAGNPLADMVPVREAAYAICAMFLGIELMTRLDPARSEADALFDMMAGMAGLAEAFMPMLVQGRVGGD